MAKLRELVTTLANLLAEPERSVNVRAMLLRKEGLIGSTGRGSAGADMTPTDATNLLLALMHTGDAKDSADVVRRLRTAELGSRYHVLPAKEIPQHRAPLGETLDSIMAKWPASHPREYVFAFDITQDFTGWYSELKFWKDMAKEPWRMVYYCPNWQMDEFSDLRSIAALNREAELAREFGLRNKSIGIPEAVFYHLGRLLRGETKSSAGVGK